MPPSPRPRPDEETYRTLVTALESALDAAAAANPNPGDPVIHRLNRTEYVNAIRDLLAVEIDGPTYLPADNSGFGFDNIGDVLSVSPALLGRYMSAARKISRLAIGDPAIRPSSRIYTVPKLLLQDDRRNEDLPFGTRGGLSVQHHFPLDGEYVIRVDFMKDYGDQWRGLHETSLIDLRVDGERLTRFTVEKSDRQLSIMAADGTAPNPGPQEYRVVTTAGVHTVSVAMVKRTLMMEGVGPERLPVGSTSYGQLNATSVTSGRIELGVEYRRDSRAVQRRGVGRDAQPEQDSRVPPVEPQRRRALREDDSREARASGVSTHADGSGSADADRLLQRGPDVRGRVRERHPVRPGAHLDCTGLLVPGGNRGAGERARYRARRRLRSGLPLVVLRVGQHPGRGAAGSGRGRHATRSGGAGAAGSPNAGRPAGRLAGEQFLRSVAHAAERQLALA